MNTLINYYRVRPRDFYVKIEAPKEEEGASNGLDKNPNEQDKNMEGQEERDEIPKGVREKANPEDSRREKKSESNYPPPEEAGQDNIKSSEDV